MPKLLDIPPYDEKEKNWRVIIDTPKQSHNKYKFDEDLEQFTLRHVLPEGMSFPYDFGFIPGTLGEDGDPLDVLLLMDQPGFCGCVVASRLIGVIEATQTEKGKTTRNDRIVGIPIQARTFSETKDFRELNKNMVREIEEFFINYNRLHGKQFKLLGLKGAAKAEAVAKAGIREYQKKHAQ